MFPCVSLEAIALGSCSVEHGLDHVLKAKVVSLMEGHHLRIDYPVHGNSVVPTYMVRIRSTTDLNMVNDIYHRGRILMVVSRNILLI